MFLLELLAWSVFMAAWVWELQTDVNRIAFENDARSLLKAYDLTPEHFGVRTVGLHRLMRDIVKAKQTIARLTKPEAQKAPSPVRRNRHPAPKDTAQDRHKAAMNGTKQEKLAHITSLIGG